MRHQIQGLAHYGTSDIVLAVGHLADQFLPVLGSDYAGVRLIYSWELEPLATAGAVAEALATVPSDEPVVVVPGDALADCDLKAAVCRFRQQATTMALLIYPVPNPRHFGVVLTDVAGRVRGFDEKSPQPPPHAPVNTGIYFLWPAASRHWPRSRPVDFAYDVFLAQIAQRQLTAWQAPGYWSDLGGLTPRAAPPLR